MHADPRLIISLPESLATPAPASRAEASLSLLPVLPFPVSLPLVLRPEAGVDA